MQSLSIMLSAGQLIALPLVIFLVVRRRYTDVPLAMVIVLVVHFAPYSWLYATPLYLVMGGTVSIVAVVAMTTSTSADAPARVCPATGAILVACACIAWVL